MGGIYSIVSLINGRMYIGSARSFRKRWNVHRHKLRMNKHANIHLQRIYNKYGDGNLIYVVLETCKDVDLIKREQYYLDTVKPDINIAPKAGSQLGFKATLEQRLYNRDRQGGCAVVQVCPKTGNVIATYESSGEAGRMLGIGGSGIRRVVRGGRRTAGGFMWFAENEYDPTSFKPTYPKQKTLSQPCRATDKEGNVLTFKSANEAAKALGLHQGNISAACRGARGRKYVGEYLFDYLDEQRRNES